MLTTNKPGSDTSQPKRNKILIRLSILLNIVLIIGILFAAYLFRAKIYDKIASSKTYKVVMFGNSLTEGGEWNKDLNRLDIKNSGTGGFTTSHFVWILDDKVIQYKPKICFIEGGINDIGVGIPLNRTFSNYQSIVDTLLKHQIEPVLQSTFYVNYPDDSITNSTNSRVDSLNIYLSSLASRKGIKYVDLNQFLSEKGRLKKELNMDGIHINGSGYKIWAKEVDRILKLKEI